MGDAGDRLAERDRVRADRDDVLVAVLHGERALAGARDVQACMMHFAAIILPGPTLENLPDFTMFFCHE